MQTKPGTHMDAKILLGPDHQHCPNPEYQNQCDELNITIRVLAHMASGRTCVWGITIFLISILRMSLIFLIITNPPQAIHILLKPHKEKIL